MKREKKDERKNYNFLRKSASTFLYGALTLFAIFAIWVIAYFATGNETLVPSLKKTLGELWLLLKDNQSGFYTAFWGTFLRVLAAFCISFFPAAALAVCAYLYLPLRKVAGGLVSIMRSLPAMAVLLMILVWSTRSAAPVAVAFLSLFPMLYTGVLSSLLSVDKKYKRVCEVYCVPVRKQVFCMYLPQVLPQVLREGAGALSFSVKLVVSAEVMANTAKSLGGLMQDSKMYPGTQMPQLFALTILVVVTGFVLETAGNFLAAAIEGRVK